MYDIQSEKRTNLINDKENQNGGQYESQNIAERNESETHPEESSRGTMQTYKTFSINQSKPKIKINKLVLILKTIKVLMIFKLQTYNSGNQQQTDSKDHPRYNNSKCTITV